LAADVAWCDAAANRLATAGADLDRAEADAIANADG
jgi:hypothetical protein